MTKPETYLGRTHVDRLERLVRALEDQVDRLKRQSASPPPKELPWMRSCVANGAGVASFDLSFYDVNTDRRIHPSAEALRNTLGLVSPFSLMRMSDTKAKESTKMSEQPSSSEAET